MKAAAEIMARQLRLSGFLGFDFIIDRHDRAWLLEMNPRATPIAQCRPCKLASHRFPPAYRARTDFKWTGPPREDHRIVSARAHARRSQ
jgi:hypothetical protein